MTFGIVTRTPFCNCITVLFGDFFAFSEDSSTSNQAHQPSRHYPGTYADLDLHPIPVPFRCHFGAISVPFSGTLPSSPADELTNEQVLKILNEGHKEDKAKKSKFKVSLVNT